MKPLAFLMVGSMFAQAPQVDVAKILGSGRSDLWVFGIDRDPINGSVLVELRSWKVPPEYWAATGDISAPGSTLYSERPKAWDWSNRPARQLHGSLYYQLSKYDDNSAFSSGWGVKTGADGLYSEEGAILRYEGGQLKLVSDGLKQARLDYGLSKIQKFMGMVGSRVFYFDTTQSDRIFFFDVKRPAERFEIIVPTRPWWPRSWKLASADQVFEGNGPDEVMVNIWVKNTAWIAVNRRDSRVIPHLSNAKTLESHEKRNGRPVVSRHPSVASHHQWRGTWKWFQNCLVPQDDHQFGNCMLAD
jgi:hypothetical protein